MHPPQDGKILQTGSRFSIGDFSVTSSRRPSMRFFLFVDLKADLLSRNCIFTVTVSPSTCTRPLFGNRFFPRLLVNFSFFILFSFYVKLISGQKNSGTTFRHRSFFSILLIFVFILEVIVEIVIEIIFEVFQIIRSYKPVYCVCDSCNCRYRSDNGKDP